MTGAWRVVALLSLASGVAYLTRADVAVAQERMVPALGLTMTAMGAITAWGFQLAYTLFQVPAGMLGERWGARTVLLLALLGGSVASFGAGLMPESSAAVGMLWVTRVLLGVSQAAIFPVAATAVMAYVPANQRVRATSFYIATSALGAAVAPLVMTPVMEEFGWRAVFLVSGAVGALTAVVWRGLMPPPPARARSGSPLDRSHSIAALVELLCDARLRRLSLAYLLHSAVYFVFLFWFLRYLIDGRGFTLLAGGLWGSLPSIAGFVCVPIFGTATDRLGRSIGIATARRLVAMGCLLSAAACVSAGALLPGAGLAVAALSLAAACINGAEAPFFMTATAIGARHPGTASGILNLMGNVGGVLSIWLVPHMAAAWGWIGTFGFWSAACVGAAGLWWTVRVDETPPAIAVVAPVVG